MDVLGSFLRFKLLFITITFSTLCSCGGGSGNGGSGEQVQIPRENRSPIIDSANEYSFKENEAVNISIQASDPDGDTLTYNLDISDDAYFFSIDSSTGLISGGSFDFEAPGDANADNVYELSVTVSDGALETTKAIKISITDIDGPLACSGPETAQIFEGKREVFHSLTLTKPDAELILLSPFLFVEVTRASDGSVVNNFQYNTSVVAEDNVATIELGLFRPVNAEILGGVSNKYLFELLAEYEGETVICSFEVEVVDDADEVQTGIKVSGEPGEHANLNVYSIGDINGDGVNDLFLNSMKFDFTYLGRFNGSLQSETPEFHGYIIDGRMIQSDMELPSGKELIARSIDDYVLHHMYGWYASLGMINNSEDLTGYELIPEPLGDLDGDGTLDLLVTLRASVHASHNAYVERPLAFVIWGETLRDSNTETDLNSLVPSQGLTLGGLGGTNRAANMSVSGDFDGDGLTDIAISSPQSILEDSQSSVYNSQLFIVFGDHIKNSKAKGQINVLEDRSDPNDVFHLSSLVVDSNVEFLLAGPNPINKLQVLGDIDGDNGEELLIGAGEKQFRVSHSIIVKSQLFMQENPDSLTLTNDIQDDYLVIIESAAYEIDIKNKTGDIDNDGINDPLITTPSFFPELNRVRLIKGSKLQASTVGVPIVAEAGNDGVVIFNITDSYVFHSASFIDDLDNDGRDDLVFSYYLDDPVHPNATISIVLAKALDEIEAGEVVMLDQIPDGLILELKNTSLDEQTSSFSILDDLDGDGISELGIHPTYPLIEAYILPSKDINEALQSGTRELDIASLFRNF